MHSYTEARMRDEEHKMEKLRNFDKEFHKLVTMCEAQT
jgi:hypothetical protein